MTVNIHYYDISAYSKSHPLYSSTNAKVIKNSKMRHTPFFPKNLSDCGLIC